MPDGSNLKPCVPGPQKEVRLYRICCFERGAVVPTVELVSAAGDEHAIELARSCNPTIEREIWDWNRLVAHLQPERNNGTPLFELNQSN